MSVVESEECMQRIACEIGGLAEDVGLKENSLAKWVISQLLLYTCFVLVYSMTVTDGVISGFFFHWKLQIKREWFVNRYASISTIVDGGNHDRRIESEFSSAHVFKDVLFLMHVFSLPFEKTCSVFSCLQGQKRQNVHQLCVSARVCVRVRSVRLIASLRYFHPLLHCTAGKRKNAAK